LLSAVTLLAPPSAGADPDPLSAYRGTNRLLVMYAPDTEAGPVRSSYPAHEQGDALRLAT
jgi:hypothetical protein